MEQCVGFLLTTRLTTGMEIRESDADMSHPRLSEPLLNVSHTFLHLLSPVNATNNPTDVSFLTFSPVL